MTGSEPLISVVMTAYNHALYVAEAVESVWSQTYPRLELVVVDDASSDATPIILDELSARSPIPMRVTQNRENIGPNRTQNKAVSLARGDLFAFMASDDKLAPNRFASQVQLFQKDPDLMVVYGNGWSFEGDKLSARLHGEETQQLLSRSAAEILKYLYTHNSPFFLQTALMKKRFLLDCGGNDEQVLGDDWVLNIRFFQRLVTSGHFTYVDEDLAYYRLHPRNLHKNFSRQMALKRQVIEKYTPPHLRLEALANIYWKQGKIALSSSIPLAGINYMVQSWTYRALSKGLRKTSGET